MTKIQNYEVYTARMQKSVYDKMFFVDKIFNENIDTFIDFGCADAELMRHLRVFMPEVRFIGYDIDDNMIAKARQNAPWAEFYSNWDDIKVDPAHTIINLSSIIHEIYSYCSPMDIETFWSWICNTGFAYITIRDMFPIPSTPCSKIYREYIIKAGYESELMDFEKHWGLVKNTKNLIHFLLKYKYKENWDREVKENYIPISINTLMERFDTYTVIYNKFEPLPYIVNQVQRDIGIDISSIPTHLHLILKRR